MVSYAGRLRPLAPANWVLVNGQDLRCLDIGGASWGDGVPVQVWNLLRRVEPALLVLVHVLRSERARLPQPREAARVGPDNGTRAGPG
jgi:hypothetical protein